MTEIEGDLVNLLAYPSHCPSHGEQDPGLYLLFAKHNYLPWETLIPCFTGGDK